MKMTTKVVLMTMLLISSVSRAQEVIEEKDQDEDVYQEYLYQEQNQELGFDPDQEPDLKQENIEDLEEKQFPDGRRVYLPGQGGFDQYKTQSLRRTKKIVLTFDDGPDAVLTPKLLDLLKKYNVKATFFMLSEKFTARNMPIIRRVIREGHTIASHHHDHENNNAKSEAVYRAELTKSILSVARILEQENAPSREIYYRFPYGAYGSRKLSYHHFNVMKSVSQYLFGDNCINFTFWDIDSEDWVRQLTNQEVLANILSNVEGGYTYHMVKNPRTGKTVKTRFRINHPMGGGVVLMHDIHARSLLVTEMLLKQIKAKGIQVVPLKNVPEYSYSGKQCRLRI